MDDAYALARLLLGLFMMLMAHRGGQYATLVMVTGGLITGFTVLSSFSATRVYLSEQFPTALRGRKHIFGASFAGLFAGVLAPYLMVPHTRSPTIFFGTIVIVVAVGAFIPLIFGKETVGQLETVAETVPAIVQNSDAACWRAARPCRRGLASLSRSQWENWRPP